MTLKYYALPATLLQTDICHHSAGAHEQRKSEVKIKYHFLLSDKWIFTVENFNRESLNSGWLINDMQKVSSLDVEKYRNKLLNGN